MPSGPGRWDIERDSKSNVDDGADGEAGAGQEASQRKRPRPRIVVAVAAAAAILTPALGAFANTSQVTGYSLRDLGELIHWGGSSAQGSSAQGSSAQGTSAQGSSAHAKGPGASSSPSAGPQSPGPEPVGPQSSGSPSGSPSTKDGGTRPADDPSGQGSAVQGNSVPENPVSNGQSTKKHSTPPVVVTTPPTGETTRKQATTASIGSPADGLTTTATAVSLRFTISPATAPSGWVWYVVVQPAHHLASDYLTKIRPTSTTMSVGVGPATGGSGATDDYRISVALINATAAQQIGAYSETHLAPDDTRYLDTITIHRRPSTP